MSDNEEKVWPWLIFTSGGSKYAINSSAIKEIVRNNTIYPVPFVPKYVIGIINCYSSPFAVVDFSLLENPDIAKSEEDDILDLNLDEKEEEEEKIFLVLKDREDVTILVSNIDKFQNQEDVTVQNFSPNDDKHFLGTITYDDTIVPIVDIEYMMDKIRGDIESI